MNKWVLGFASVLAIATTWPVAAQTAAVAVDSRPGAVTEARTVKTEGTISAIDATTRVVTLLGMGGNSIEIEAGPEVKNFAQLGVGDVVELEMLEALTLELRKDGKALVARTELGEAVGAEAGSKPGGAVGRQVKVIADVIAVDTENHTVTLKGPERTVDLRVDDPAQLALIKVGDQVEGTYTEAVAIVVRPKAKAE
jgi:Cu/Ag efflux protein CusF